MGVCVLLVEHDERVLHQLGRGLRDAGFLVMPLGDADQAIDLLCLVSFDLVLADSGTLRFAAARGSNSLTALVQAIRGAPLLLFTTPATCPPGSPGETLLLEQAGRDFPRLLSAIERLIRDSPLLATHPPAPFDAGDVDDLAFPPHLIVDDNGSLTVRRQR